VYRIRRPYTMCVVATGRESPRGRVNLSGTSRSVISTFANPGVWPTSSAKTHTPVMTRNESRYVQIWVFRIDVNYSSKPTSVLRNIISSDCRNRTVKFVLYEVCFVKFLFLHIDKLYYRKCLIRLKWNNIFPNKPEMFIACWPFVARAFNVMQTRVACVFGDFQGDRCSRTTRVDIKFCVKLGKSFTETHKTMRNAYGDQCSGRTRCYDCLKRFKRRSGVSWWRSTFRTRASTSTDGDRVTRVNEIVRSNRRLEKIFVTCRSVHVMKSWWKSFWNAAPRCSNICQEFLDRANGDGTFVKRIITGDETLWSMALRQKSDHHCGSGKCSWISQSSWKWPNTQSIRPH